jgi:hypothetical protein
MWLGTHFGLFFGGHWAILKIKHLVTLVAGQTFFFFLFSIFYLLRSTHQRLPRSTSPTPNLPDTRYCSMGSAHRQFPELRLIKNFKPGPGGMMPVEIRA